MGGLGSGRGEGCLRPCPQEKTVKQFVSGEKGGMGGKRWSMVVERRLRLETGKAKVSQPVWFLYSEGKGQQWSTQYVDHVQISSDRSSKGVTEVHKARS